MMHSMGSRLRGNDTLLALVIIREFHGKMVPSESGPRFVVRAFRSIHKGGTADAIAKVC